MGLSVPVFAANYGSYTYTNDSMELRFDAASVAKETIKLENMDTGAMEDTQITMITVEPGSSVSVQDKIYNVTSLNVVSLAWADDGSGYYAYPAALSINTGKVDAMFENISPKTLYVLESTWNNGEWVCVKLGSSAQTPVTANSFSDVKADAYYAAPIKWAVDKGVTNGTSATTFSPDQTCTNAQILTFIWRANGSSDVSANPFANLNGSEYYANAAAWAAEKNMVSGSAFDASKPCTRAMTVEYFWKQAGSPNTELTGKFTDIPADASYAQAVAWAVENGITAGTSDTTFSPDSTCTRGQIVTFLYRALNK